MRKKKMLAVIVVAMSVMMAATACGSKDSTKAETKQETTEKTSATDAASGKVEGTKESVESEDSEEASDDEEETTAETEQNTSGASGNIDSGVFTSASGKYQITPPSGWSVDQDGDESVAAFTSPDGNDILEVTYVEGDDANDAREVYPETMEEYKDLIDRGEDMEFVRYDVQNGSDGSQTFRYAIRYNDPSDGVYYYAIAGSYNAATKTYLSASGTVESSDSAVENQIEAALDTLKLK